MDAKSRRGFLKLAGLGAVGGVIGPRAARAQQKTLTVLHESSFIKTFDEYFQKTLAPAYEKETGVKVNYELTSVGSLPTRVSTISETGSRPCEKTIAANHWAIYCRCAGYGIAKTSD